MVAALTDLQWGYIATLAGVALGGILAGGFGVLQARHAAASDRESSRLEFQRSTLLDLQTHMEKLVRATYEVVVAQWPMLPAPVEWTPPDREPHHAAGECHGALLAVKLLSTRINDRELVELTATLQGLVIEATHEAKTGEAAIALVAEVADVEKRALRRAGEVARSL